jgi:hypothetical protein
MRSSYSGDLGIEEQNEGVLQLHNLRSLEAIRAIQLWRMRGRDWGATESSKEQGSVPLGSKSQNTESIGTVQ